MTGLGTLRGDLYGGEHTLRVETGSFLSFSISWETESPSVALGGMLG